jgi:hypothetical protein
MDSLLIQEVTDMDSVVVEIILGNFKFYTANMYLDITEEMDETSETIKDILRVANTRGILITMDSISRSRMWHDKLNNGRGKKLEVFPISKQLPIMSEDSEMKTFQSSRGSSNIDLIISNNKLLKVVQEWKIREEESCSNHGIFQFCIGQHNAQQTANKFQCIKYIISDKNHKK